MLGFVVHNHWVLLLQTFGCSNKRCDGVCREAWHLGDEVKLRFWTTNWWECVTWAHHKFLD
jgi:hypothetical protein